VPDYPRTVRKGGFLVFVRLIVFIEQWYYNKGLILVK